jgi:hypothetical protein
VDRRALVITFIAFGVLAGAFVLVNLMGPAPEPEPTVEERPAPAPAPAAPRVEAPAPVPEPAAPRSAPKVAPVRPASEPVEAPVDATLQIDSDVRGAQVFIDRVFVGAAPVSVPNVSVGTHRLNVSAPGYEGVAETIEVTPGPRDILIKFKEVRLDAKLDVVHKHRLGSCKGMLVATPLGLRYETTNKEDAFTAALLDLETFQVEYAEKNLRVQPRKSKRYDFTDPEGDADRLFVFHRDVEKAREQLKRGNPPASR